MLVRFADCDVDLDRVEIHRGDDLVPVEPQVFDVLTYLIEHRERVVTKEELLDNIWGDRFVSESALTSRIKSARQALGDNGRDQAVIKTIHGRGYRFVATVSLVDADAAPAADATGAADRVITAPATAATTNEDQWPLVGRYDDLDRLREYFDDRTYSGVLLTGPSGVGKTRLATEYLALAESAGVRTVRIAGAAESAAIPLGSISHLLQPDVLDVADRDPELARAVVFQRARAALGELGDESGLVIFVDNVDLVDELSSALLGSLLSSDSVFAIMTQRTDEGDPLAFSELVRSHQVARLDLGPLDDTDLDVLLYRVLSGPIDLRSLESLTQFSRGRPGALEQLVSSSRATGSLERRSGVWRLVGPIRVIGDSNGDEPAAIGALPPEVREAAELLGVAVELDLDLATELIGAESLDALDRLGMLALTDSADGPRVSLSRADVGSTLADSLGPLRARRHKARLVELLGAQSELGLADTLRLARWSVEIGSPPGRDAALSALRFAVSTADAANGDVLLDHLDRDAPGADVAALRAELAFRLGQVEAADEQLDAIDVTELSPIDAARVVRRRCTILFHVRGRYDDAIDAIVNRAAELDAGDPALEEGRVLLLAHAIGLMGFVGYADRIDSLVAELPASLDGPAALEVLRGRAQAAFVRGKCDETLRLIERHRTASAGLDPAAAQAGDEVALAIELNALAVMGRLPDALDLLRRHLPVGRRTLLAWLPLSASRALLAAGRPADARSVIMTPLAAVRSQNLLHAEPLMTGVLAQATARLGDLDATRAQLDLTERSRSQVVGHMRWTLNRSIVDTLLVLGDLDRALEIAMADVDDAIGHGASGTAADLLMLAAFAGGATEAAERLHDLAGDFDGPLWPLRVRHVEALADRSGAALDGLAAEYRALGYEGLATLAGVAAR